MSRKPLKKPKRAGSFIQLHEEILASPAYRDLNPVARCLLTEFQRIYRPSRNGRLSISVMNAAKLIRANKDTASKAFRSLAEHGFIVLTKGAYWQERLAREWRITFEEFNGREPTDDWKQWRLDQPVVTLPKKSRSQTRGQSRPNPRDSLSGNKGQGLLSKQFMNSVYTQKQ